MSKNINRNCLIGIQNIHRLAIQSLTGPMLMGNFHAWFLSISLGTKLTNGEHLSVAVFPSLYFYVPGAGVTWREGTGTVYDMLCHMNPVNGRMSKKNGERARIFWSPTEQHRQPIPYT